VERARQCTAEHAEELIEALQKMQNQNTELENKYESLLEANAYLAEQNNAQARSPASFFVVSGVLSLALTVERRP
jgi:hypothetical protein